MNRPTQTPESSGELGQLSPDRAIRDGWLMFVVVFVGLLLVRHEILDSPPYEDQGMLWQEASYLVETNFDYYRLRYEEPHWIESVDGVRDYLISLLPAVLAVMMKLFPRPADTILAYHVFTISCAALIAATMYVVLHRRIGKQTALLATLALLTAPLFSTQIDMVGMELPMVAAAILTARAIWNERYTAAAGWSLLAFLCKVSGALLTVSSLAWLLLCIVVQRRRSSSRKLLVAIGVHTVVLLVEFGLYRWADSPPLLAAGDPRFEILSLPMAIYACPDLLLLAAVCLVAAMILAIGWWRHASSGQGVSMWDRCRNGLRTLLENRSVASYSALVILVTVAAVTQVLFIPRYLTLAVPFLYLILADLFGRLPVPGGLIRLGLVVLIALNVANFDGRFFPDIQRVHAERFARNPEFHARSGAFTERSREFLVDHRSNIAAMKQLDAVYEGEPVFVTMPFTQLLRSPRLGYVTQAMDVRVADDLDTGVRAIREIAATASKSQEVVATFLWTGKGRLTLPAPAAGDDEIYRDKLTPPLVVFRPRLSDQKLTADAAENWYLDRTWDTTWAAARCEARLTTLLRGGQIERAIRETEFAHEVDPDSQDLADRLADLNQLQHQIAQWATSYPSLVDTQLSVVALLATGLDARTNSPLSNLLRPLSRTHSENLLTQGIASLAGERLEEAIEELTQALEAPQEQAARVLTLYLLGKVHRAYGELERAVECFTAIDRLTSTFPESHYELGLILGQQARWSDAEHHLREAIRLAPNYADAYCELGIVAQRSGATDQARKWFRRAAEIRPDWATPKRLLAALDAESKT